jgi:DNA-binding response OmpR family regulator
MALVLLVEDDENLRTILLGSLPYFGAFEMVGASDGKEGLEKCVQLKPACMIIDLRMPELNGYQLVRALRGDPATAAIPLIIFSAMPHEEARFIGIISGADRYLQKPTRLKDLAQVIKEVIQSTTDARTDQRDAQYNALLETLEIGEE